MMTAGTQSREQVWREKGERERRRRGKGKEEKKTQKVRKEPNDVITV
jgi:hypothetical protein